MRWRDFANPEDGWREFAKPEISWREFAKWEVSEWEQWRWEAVERSTERWVMRLAFVINPTVCRDVNAFSGVGGGVGGTDSLSSRNENGHRIQQKDNQMMLWRIDMHWKMATRDDASAPLCRVSLPIRPLQCDVVRCGTLYVQLCSILAAERLFWQSLSC